MSVKLIQFNSTSRLGRLYFWIIVVAGSRYENLVAMSVKMFLTSKFRFLKLSQVVLSS